MTNSLVTGLGADSIVDSMGALAAVIVNLGCGHQTTVGYRYNKATQGKNMGNEIDVWP